MVFKTSDVLKRVNNFSRVKFLSIQEVSSISPYSTIRSMINFQCLDLSRVLVFMSHKRIERRCNNSVKSNIIMATNTKISMHDEIINLIKQCGDELPPLSGTIADIGVKKKWLTEKDGEIEKRLSDLIVRFDGEHEIFAEEFHDDYREAENVWIIDPISNTMGFINGWTHYSVVVSHMHKGVLQFGAVYDPIVKELFTAYKGKGAFLNGKKIQVSQRIQDLSFLFQASVGPLYEKDWLLKVYSSLLDLGRVNTLGSLGLNYCYVACGRVDAVVALNKDAFPEFAGKIIIEEAGGVLTDLKGDTLTKDSKGILACRKDMHEQCKCLCL